MWIKRDLTNTIKKRLDTKKVILLTGSRQTGKSSLLKKLFPNFSYISLDRPLTAEQAKNSGESFINSLNTPAIIDEVQYAPELFRHLKFFIDAKDHKKTYFILTGSQKFSLMQGVSDSLAGRISLLDLHSLSLNEIQGLTSEVELNQNRLKDLMFKGGYPEIWNESIDPNTFFYDYISTYIQKDIRQIINIKQLAAYERFMTMLALRAGQILNLSSLANETRISATAAKAWLNALEVSNVIYILKPYYKNLGKRLVKSPKVYFLDSGLLCNLMGFKNKEELTHSGLLGHIFENYVFEQMIKTKHNKGERPNYYFYRDHRGLEVDFIEPVGEKLSLFECKWSENPETKLKAFKEIENLIGSENIIKKNILSSSPESYTKNGCRVLSLKDL